LQWIEECACNSGKTNFEAIEFSTNNSRMELVCGKCHGVICWWHLSTEQIEPFDELRTKEKSLTIPTRSK
jgi:hypothetical protein